MANNNNIFAERMEGEIDERNQLLVAVVDVNPNQLLFARSPGLIGLLNTKNSPIVTFIRINFFIEL